MTYSDVARAVSEDLAVDDDDELAEAALQLAVQAWQALAVDDPTWDALGLELLDARSRLHPDRTVTVLTAPPTADRPDNRVAVAALVVALATRHERIAGDAARALPERLALDSVAVRLRHAVAALR